MKQLGSNSPPGEAPAQAASVNQAPIPVDDFDFFEYQDRDGVTRAALQHVTDKYNEILRRRYITDPVTVLQYVTVELSNRETVIWQIGLPDPEVIKIADDLSRKITRLLELYKSQPHDPRFSCEPSIQAFKRQIRLDGGMARLVTAYQSDIKAAYMLQNRHVFVALPFIKSVPRMIKPANHKENMYRSNLIEGQFAQSGASLSDYILRAAIGGNMYTNGDFTMFPRSPVSEFKTSRKAILVSPVALCEVSALEMDPEVSIDMTWSDTNNLGVVAFRPFDGEWTRKTRGLPESMKMLPVLSSHVLTWIPSQHFLQKQVRCRGPEGVIDLSVLCRTALDSTWQLKNKV